MTDPRRLELEAALARGRRSSPAAQRNRDVILDVLRTILPQHGCVLEIASGSGEHVAHFAANLPGLSWQPSDPSAPARASIAAWTSGLPNVAPALALDVTGRDWAAGPFAALLACNMIHISPWAATLGLFAGAAHLLPAGAPLLLYGPFMVGGAHTAPSNAAFDNDLRARNPAWGVRDQSAVAEVAVANGFALAQVIEMPANNRVLHFARQG